MENSELYRNDILKDKILSVRRAKSIEDSLSNGRKIFRFLLFLNEFTELNEILRNNKMKIGLKLLKIVSSLSSFFYYLFDNLVWFA